jgi:EpsI family protein
MIKTSFLKLGIVLALVWAAIGLNAYFSKPEISLPRKNLKEFPRILGDWKTIKDYQIDEGAMKILNVDDYIMRDYVSEKGERIGLYIGYFKSQREGKGIHSPRQCLPGAGWQPVSTSIYMLPLSNPLSSTAPINQYIMGKGTERQLYLFWYQGRGRTYASEYWNKIYLVWDAFKKKRTDGALIRLNQRISGESTETLNQQLQFIHLLLPILRDYIPE